MTLKRLGLLVVVLSSLLSSAGCVHLQQPSAAACCPSPCGGRGASDVLMEAMRTDFHAMWRAYKKARLGGDIGSSLMFHPVGHVVRTVRDDRVRMVTRSEAEEDARRRYLKIEDIDGPRVVAEPCGCGIWVVGRIRVVYVPPGATAAVEEEESYLAEHAPATNDWRLVATQNGIEDPRRLEPGSLVP